ncbi:MFS transporter [Cohnella cholangitidis]|uniref:NarK/NasA family nitrate transporter n=1 Tax=Cohnella cholangitidis TaxID=2598458 RepID=A0A7G5C124_9BACL|nr:MFS transporter [Cohnella cholangitidis]QMV42908.1 NarK/NasA family nitrate transporter [Cohnella cholangitidis]
MVKSTSTQILVFSTLAMTASFMIWSLFAPLAGSIQEMLHLSTLQKSVLIATPVLLGSIMRIPMGIYTDRLGGRKMFVGTMLFLVLPLLAAGWVKSYPLLLLCALFIGMAGTTFAISLTYVSRWFSADKQGFVLGLAGLGNLGTAASSYLMPVIYGKFGYQWVFWSMACMIVVTALVFWFGTSELPKPSQAKTFKQAMSVVKEKPTRYLSLFYFLTFGGFVAFSVYLPTLLKELFDRSTEDAGIQTAAFVLLATLIRPLGGYLADKIGSQKVLDAVFAGIAVAALLIAVSVHHDVPFMIVCLFLGGLLGIGNGAVFKMVPEVSTGNTGAVTGIVGAAGGVGGFFPPIVLGIVQQQTGGFALGFVFMAIFAGVCLWGNRVTRAMQASKRMAVTS